jgi:hypothetical protein
MVGQYTQKNYSRVITTHPKTKKTTSRDVRRRIIPAGVNNGNGVVVESDSGGTQDVNAEVAANEDKLLVVPSSFTGAGAFWDAIWVSIIVIVEATHLRIITYLTKYLLPALCLQLLW